MLALPIAKPIGSVDTSSIINCLVSQHYQEDLVRSDVAVLENLRSMAVSTVDASENGQQNIIRYCNHLKYFVPRFNGLETQMKLVFTWNDAFGINMNHSSNNFYFDWAVSVWNLAAFESLMGARVDRTTENGIRDASKHFQQAAGYIQYIINELLPRLNMSNFPCLSHDGLHMALNLMLSQAQLCFYEKAVKDKKKDLMKSSIIAKLAKQVSIYYSTTGISCRVGTLGSILDISWFAIAEFQTKCFAGAAEYWQAQASKEAALMNGSGFGEEVARYNRAEAHVNDSLAQTKKYPSISTQLSAGANALLQAIREHRTTADTDLRTAYVGEMIPRDNELKDIVPVAMVRPATVFAKPAGGDSEGVLQLFKYVLPQEIRMLIAQYNEEMQMIFATATSAAENATNHGRITLSDVGLPGSLEAVKSECPLPDSLWTKVQRAQSMGGYERLKSLLKDLESASRRTSLSIENINEALDGEERTDLDFLTRYPEFAANSTRSSTLNADVRGNVNRMKEAHANALSNDQSLGGEITSAEAISNSEILMKSRDEMLKMFSDSSASTTPNLIDFGDDDTNNSNQSSESKTIEMEKLEKKLLEMAEVVENREKIIGNLKNVMNIDITELSVEAIGKNLDVRGEHTKLLSQAKELQSQCTNGIDTQSILLQEILRLNQDFEKSREMNPLMMKRREIILKIEQAVAKFSLLHSQLSAGITFYTSLQSKLTALLQTACDVAYTQQWQRQDYEAQQNSSMERSAQEIRDHEMAMQLANRLAQGQSSQGSTPHTSLGNTPSAPLSAPQPFNPMPVASSGVAAVPVQQSSYPSATTGLQQQFSSTVQQQYQPAAGGVVYGNPVSGPPANSTTLYQQSSSQPAVTGGYQYNANSYNATPPAVPQVAPSQYQPAVQQQAPNYQQQPGPAAPVQQRITDAEFNAKINRLSEMGFDRDQVAAALRANNMEDEAALNCLLSGSITASQPQQQYQQPALQQPYQQQYPPQQTMQQNQQYYQQPGGMVPPPPQQQMPPQVQEPPAKPEKQKSGLFKLWGK